MSKKKASQDSFRGKYLIGAFAFIFSCVIIISLVRPGFFKADSQSAVQKTGLNTESFGVNLVTGQVVPSQPTTNPADPYDPMPLRVGTVGATIYHYPFCPYAKQSLANYGLPNRINYWTREQVAESNRPADTYCIAGSFSCLNVEPAEFAIAGNDPWCGANVRPTAYVITGIDVALVEKTLCSLQGRIGVFVDDPADCANGLIRGSNPSCDQAACETCTIDCVVACTGCVKVTMAALNKITLSLGDANRDGQADMDDYLYYHECYSGTTSATVPCQNIFDFDHDTDVDATDFNFFVQAYNTGNESWASANYSNATINPPKTEPFLRVGTDESAIYHRVGCPAVNRSWQTWGIDRRIDFFTWEQVENSRRIPDINVCLPGTRENPSGTWQNCTLDDDEDGTLNCDDGCPANQYKTEPGICGCGLLDTDTDNNGIPDCNDPVSVLYEDAFETIGDPTGWFDTGANNSLLEEPLAFTVVDQGTFVAFNTSLGYINSYSHYTPSTTWTGYKYVGKMMATGTTNIGVTFFSDYPNSDTYYRLRSWTGSPFHIAPHGTSVTGNPDTGVIPILNTWYNFSIWVRNTTTNGTEIFAKVWVEGDLEPFWQLTCYDNSTTKLTQGSFGIWSSSGGDRYWDNITVTNY